VQDLDLLLINRSNYPAQPIFPYAFVQVSALARRRALTVERFECFGRTEADAEMAVGRIIADRRPRLIGITLRQADSQLLGDYWTPFADVDRAKRGYFPLEDTLDLVRFLRSVTDAKIILGGFGFSVHGDRLMHVLQPDFGIVGEPDGMFEAYEDLLAERRLEQIPNLLYWEGSQVKRGPHRLFDSPRDTEYTEEIVAELKAFYGRGIPQETVAVELARGCPYRCFFCAEPIVKGRSVRHRPLDVVVEELEFLLAHGLTSFWLVCSELNVGNADKAMEVAEALTRLRERHPTTPLTWRAYHLPKWLSEEHLRVLARSGFEGGWNDFPSLDDANLRACRVPYRAAHAVRALTAGVESADQQGAPVRGSMFFGNAHMDPAGIATTLRAFHDADLCNRYDSFYAVTSTRLFEVPAMADFRTEEAVTFMRDGRSPTTDLAHPTYYWPEKLVTQLGSVLEVEEFFVWMVRAFLLKDPARHFPVPPELAAKSPGAEVDRAAVWDAIGAPHRDGELEGSPYELECLLLSRFASWDDLDGRLAACFGDRAAPHSAVWSYCRGRLFEKGVRLRPAYVKMIVPER